MAILVVAMEMRGLAENVQYIFYLVRPTVQLEVKKLHKLRSLKVHPGCLLLIFCGQINTKFVSCVVV